MRNKWRGGRKGGWEGGGEEGMKGGMKGGRNEGREAWREGGMEGGREGGMDGWKNYINHCVCAMTNKSYPFSLLSSATTRFSVLPTANIQACGGLITAEKFFIPNIPRFEMVIVPP